MYIVVIVILSYFLFKKTKETKETKATKATKATNELIFGVDVQSDLNYIKDFAKLSNKLLKLQKNNLCSEIEFQSIKSRILNDINDEDTKDCDKFFQFINIKFDYDTFKTQISNLTNFSEYQMKSMYNYGKLIVDFLNTHEKVICEDGNVNKVKVSKILDIIFNVVCDAETIKNDNAIGFVFNTENELIKDLVILFNKIKYGFKNEICKINASQHIEDMIKDLGELNICEINVDSDPVFTTQEKKLINDFISKYIQLICKYGVVSKRNLKTVLLNIHKSLCN